jgi:hypothetical protein
MVWENTCSSPGQHTTQLQGSHDLDIIQQSKQWSQSLDNVGFGKIPAIVPVTTRPSNSAPANSKIAAICTSQTHLFTCSTAKPPEIPTSNTTCGSDGKPTTSPPDTLRGPDQRSTSAFTTNYTSHLRLSDSNSVLGREHPSDMLQSTRTGGAVVDDPWLS